MRCRLQRRDVDILKAVGDFGCLTAKQVTRLCFANLKVCRRRLAKLRDAGYLATVPLPVRDPGGVPLLFYLGHGGASLLRQTAQKPRLTTQLSHQQANTDLLIDIALTFAETDFKCELLPEHVIRQARPSLVPDGAFLLRRGDRSALFLAEHCNATEPIRSPSLYDDVEAKLTRYVTAFEENQVALYERYLECADLNRFRVLFIVRGDARLSGIMDVARQHDFHGFVLGATRMQFRRQGVLGSIWQSVNAERLSIV